MTVLQQNIMKTMAAVMKKDAESENYQTMKYKHWQLIRMQYMQPICPKMRCWRLRLEPKVRSARHFIDS